MGVLVVRGDGVMGGEGMGRRRTVCGCAVEDVEAWTRKVYGSENKVAPHVVFDDFMLVAEALELGWVLRQEVLLLAGLRLYFRFALNLQMWFRHLRKQRCSHCHSWMLLLYTILLLSGGSLFSSEGRGGAAEISRSG